MRYAAPSQVWKAKVPSPKPVGVAPLPPLRWKVTVGAVEAVPLLRAAVSRPAVKVVAALTVRALVLLEPRTESPLAVNVPGKQHRHQSHSTRAQRSCGQEEQMVLPCQETVCAPNKSQCKNTGSGAVCSIHRKAALYKIILPLAVRLLSKVAAELTVSVLLPLVPRIAFPAAVIVPGNHVII